MLNFYAERDFTLPDKTRTGVNTAVVLYHLDRLRRSDLYAREVQLDAFGPLAVKYSFKGTLGDQES
jgi:hypothetical protein